MSYRGDFRLGDTLDVKFTTVGTTGAPTTLAGTPVVSAYVDNGTTEITAGITLTVDFDGRTGLHNVRVVATSGNGFAAATNVDLVITTGTVGGTSVVGYVIGSFSIEDRSAFSRLGAPAGASVSADIAAAKADTAAIKTKTDFLPSATAGAAGGVFIAGSNAATTVNFTGNLSGSVGSVTGLTVANLDAAVSSRMASYTQPTGFLAATFPGTVASPTNITAATGVTLAAVTHTGAIIPTVSTVTGLTAADVGAIKAKTDSLNFTVAGVVNANTLRIAGTTIVGNGVAPKFGV